MTKTYTLAEILADHMDAVQEGSVRNAEYMLRTEYQQVRLFHGRTGGSARCMLLNGYTIDAVELEDGDE